MYQKRNVSALLSLFLLLLCIEACKHEIPANPLIEIPVGNTTDPCDANKVYFEQQVLPILVSNCAKSGCHDNSSHKEGVVLTSYSSVINTGGIRAGNAGESKLYKLIVTTNSGDRMPQPPDNPLTQEQKNLIYNWIQQGAQNLICQNMCDSTIYTLSGSIKNIISAKCQGCHSGISAGGSIDFTTYAGIKATISSGKLWGSINQLPGYSAMPKNGSKLSACEITQFRKWIDAGSLNN